MLITRTFYLVKPLIPRSLQIAIRRVLVRRQLKKSGDVWPIDRAAAAKPAGWPGWPEGKQFAVILTHDVDTARGQDRCRDLRDLEMRAGFRASFNFVPERYKVSAELRQDLVRDGFEVGVHGLYHDGKYYQSRQVFRDRAQKINSYIRAWGASGFRAPSMLHKLEWFHELDIAYDASTFDTDPFEPNSRGVRTIFPFWYQQPGERGFVELPYTLPQDFTMFILMQETNVDIWKRKIDWIAENGGMVLINTHPDYMHFGNGAAGPEDYPAALYGEVLDYLRTKYRDRYWHALPKEAAAYMREQMKKPATAEPAAQVSRAAEASGTEQPAVCMLGYFDYENDSRVQNYVTMLRGQGYAVDVVCCGDRSYVSKDDEYVRVFGVQSRQTKEKRRRQYLWNLVRFFLRAMVKVSSLHMQRKYQVVHVHNVPDFLVFTAWLPKLTGAGLILDIHDILPEFYARKFGVDMNNSIIRALKLVEKASCSFADHIIVANDIWCERVAGRSARKDKCTSFTNYIDTTIIPLEQPRKPRAGNGVFTLIYHGTYSEHHGLDVAIRAMHLLKERIGPCRLLLYGGGPYEGELRSLIAELRLEDRVLFCGSVPYQEVPKILKSADLGIVPKKDGLFVGEAMSTKLFQYAAMGIPTVVSRTVAEQRYFGDNEVKYFSAGEPGDMARCIEELYRDPQGRHDMAARALERMGGYSLSANTPRYLGIIERLTGRTGQ